MRQLAKACVWAAALAGLFALSTPSRADSKNRVVCYTSYDTDYFYAAVSVRKPNLRGTQTAPFSDPVKDDAVAVFLQAEDEPAGPQRTKRSVEMAVSAAGGAQLYRGADATPLKGLSDFLFARDQERMVFKYAVNLRGALNQPGDNNTMYTVEMAIPWVELGGAPAAGTRMRFNVVAFSAAAGSPAVLSLSPNVTGAADVQNPSKWQEIVFVEAPVKTVASAPNARVSARIFSARPLIDGNITEGEWNAVTAFGFEAKDGGEGGSEDIAPTGVTARVRPKVELKPGRPAIAPPAVPFPGRAAALKPHAAQTLPHMVLSLFNYDFQADPRKGLPLMSATSSSGASLLADHPLSGPGPWMTYDRVDWHLQQFYDVRRAGIDVILPVYRAGVTDKQRYSQRGLMAMVGALRYLALHDADYPLVGLYLDTTSLSGPRGGRPDLTASQGQAQLYAAIKDFYLAVPPAFRAAIALDPKNGGGTANVVVLSSASAFSAVDASFVDYCRRRFAADFGADLLILGGTDFKGKAPLDGYMDDTRGHGFQASADGWLKTATVGVGYDETLSQVTETSLRSRQDGDTYRGEWKQALAARPDWVFIGGWNDFQNGAEIAPSMEYGITYVDLTRVYTRAFAGTGQMRASFVANTIPSAAKAGSTCAATVRVMNAGTIAWTPDNYGLVFRWDGQSGAPTRAALPSVVLPGQAATVSLPLTIPSAGAHALTVDVAQVGRKGDVTALFSSLGSTPLKAEVQAFGDAGDGVQPYGITLVSADMPTTLEAGGTYNVRVTLRNDGSRVWKKDGGRIAGRVLRYTSPLNATGEAESLAGVPMADASAPLPNDVAPGQTVTVPVQVTFSQADGNPLIAWSETDNWIYEMAWEYSADASGSAGALTAPEAIALVDADLGVQFADIVATRQMPAEHRIPVRLSIRNAGPQTWRKDVTRVGYHWYYLDGTEAVWQDETTPISQDVEPGQEARDIIAWITPPPNDGEYWLVWDLKVGDTWASTLSSARPFETLVRPVRIVKGHLSFADLSKAYNTDGIASYADRADGNADGAGHTLPAELTPPYVGFDTAPSGIWLPVRGSGLDASRRISFRWGTKGDKDKNLVSCSGQRVELFEPKKAPNCTAVHLLAASTGKEGTVGFTLVFADGSQQYTSFPIGRWDAEPKHGERIAFVARFTYGRGAHSALDKPAALFDYTIKVPETKKLVALLLPDAPDVKVAAVTVER